jgi:hypothetical protein
MPVWYHGRVLQYVPWYYKRRVPYYLVWYYCHTTMVHGIFVARVGVPRGIGMVPYCIMYDPQPQPARPSQFKGHIEKILHMNKRYGQQLSRCFSRVSFVPKWSENGSLTALKAAWSMYCNTYIPKMVRTYVRTYVPQWYVRTYYTDERLEFGVWSLEFGVWSLDVVG